MNHTVNELLHSLPRAAGDEATMLFEVKWIESAWHKVCAKTGITDLRFHDLRHTFASRLLEARASLQEVRDFLGHTSASITLRYTHTNSSALRKAVEALDEKLHPHCHKICHNRGFEKSVSACKCLKRLVAATGLEPVT